MTIPRWPIQEKQQTRETKTRETKTRDVRTRPKPIMSKKTPHAGLEPATLSLEGWCSSDWANKAAWSEPKEEDIYFSTLMLQPTTQPFSKQMKTIQEKRERTIRLIDAKRFIQTQRQYNTTKYNPRQDSRRLSNPWRYPDAKFKRNKRCPHRSEALNE